MTAETPDSPLQALKQRVQDPSRVRTRANAITAFRVLFAIPMLILMYQVGPSWWTWSAWAILAFTDYLDGWLARRDGATHSGAFLDPLADKVLVMGGLITLAVRGDFAWLPVVIIGVREVVVSVYRSAAARRGVSMPARPLGKWKATIQYLAVAIALFPPTAGTPGVADAALWVAVALTVVSGVDLVVHARRPPTAGGVPTS